MSAPGAITFALIDPNNRTPGQFTEFNSARASAGLASAQKTLLVIGEKTADGTVEALTPTQIQSGAQAVLLAGKRSNLGAMCAALFSVNSQTNTYLIAMESNEDATANVTTLGFTGPATAAGTLFLYVGGKQIQVGIDATDTAAEIAGKVVTAVNAWADPVSGSQLQFLATQSGADVVLTAQNAGVLANFLDVRLNYNGETTPAGVGMTVTQTTAGAGEPSLAEVIAVLGDVQYTSIISPYTDATSLTALETEMESRWGPGRQIPGRLYAASNDTFSDVETLGSSRNSKQSVILGVPKSPSTPWEMAAILAGVEALQTNPAQPYTGLALPGLLAPARNDVLTREERNLLLYDGISTCVVDNAGNVSIERLITTYQTNAESVPDAAYLDLCSIQTLDALRYSLNTAFALKYPRYNLANDNDPVSPGQQILTPRTATAEIISIFDQWAAQGWVVNRAQFVGDIVCQRNAGNPNRLDVQLAPEIIALFLQFAAQVAFLL